MRIVSGTALAAGSGRHRRLVPLNQNTVGKYFGDSGNILDSRQII